MMIMVVGSYTKVMGDIGGTYTLCKRSNLCLTSIASAANSNLTKAKAMIARYRNDSGTYLSVAFKIRNGYWFGANTNCEGWKGKMP